LTPSQGAAWESWPEIAWLAPWLLVAEPCDNVAAAVWAWAARVELLELSLLEKKRNSDVERPVELPSEWEADPPGWRPFGCGATKKLFVVSLVPKLYIRRKDKNKLLYWMNHQSF